MKARAKTKFDSRKVTKAVERANFRGLGHAAAAIRLVARHSIKKSPKKSPAGTPPNTRKGRIKNAIKYAIKYAVIKSPPSAVIGPDVDVAGTSGKAHEFGGRYKKEHYEKRAFMGPALEKTKERLPAFWAGSVKGG